jgi:hypothetical protein
MEVDCARAGGADGRSISRADDGDAAEGVVNVPLGNGACLTTLDEKLTGHMECLLSCEA